MTTTVLDTKDSPQAQHLNQGTDSLFNSLSPLDWKVHTSETASSKTGGEDATNHLLFGNDIYGLSKATGVGRPDEKVLNSAPQVSPEQMQSENSALKPSANPFNSLATDAAKMSTLQQSLQSSKVGSPQFIETERELRAESKVVVNEMALAKQQYPGDSQYAKLWQTARTDLALTNSNLWHIENTPSTSQTYKNNLQGLGQNEPLFQSDLAKMTSYLPATSTSDNLILDV